MISDFADPKCEECGGEGVVEYGNIRSESDGCKTMECQKCFPFGFEDDSDDRPDD